MSDSDAEPALPSHQAVVFVGLCLAWAGLAKLALIGGVGALSGLGGCAFQLFAEGAEGVGDGAAALGEGVAEGASAAGEGAAEGAREVGRAFTADSGDSMSTSPSSNPGWFMYHATHGMSVDVSRRDVQQILSRSCASTSLSEGSDIT